MEHQFRVNDYIQAKSIPIHFSVFWVIKPYTIDLTLKNYYYKDS